MNTTPLVNTEKGEEVGETGAPFLEPHTGTGRGAALPKGAPYKQRPSSPREDGGATQGGRHSRWRGGKGEKLTALYLGYLNYLS